MFDFVYLKKNDYYSTYNLNIYIHIILIKKSLNKI